MAKSQASTASLATTSATALVVKEWWLRRKDSLKKPAPNSGKLQLSHNADVKLKVALQSTQEDYSLSLASKLAELEADAYAMNSSQDKRRAGWNAQTSEESATSTGSTLSLAELSSISFFSRQCSEIDSKASKVVSETVIKDAFRAVVADCQFCVTIADPRDPEVPLIAVSDQFEAITGFSKSELIGNNCRVLRLGCMSDELDLLSLRQACKTGASFTAVMHNRRKSGDNFLILLDLRGLTVAQNPWTGEELWFLIGIQADVTNLTHEDANNENLPQLQEIAGCIRAKLVDELKSLAVAGALMSNFEGQEEIDTSLNIPEDAWCILPEPTWKHGGHLRGHLTSPLLANPVLTAFSLQPTHVPSEDSSEMRPSDTPRYHHSMLPLRHPSFKLWQVLFAAVSIGGAFLLQYLRGKRSPARLP
jgi:hypothetical protein